MGGLALNWPTGTELGNILRATTRIHFKRLGMNEWLLGNKRRISFLLEVVNSTQHIAE